MRSLFRYVAVLSVSALVLLSFSVGADEKGKKPTDQKEKPPAPQADKKVITLAHIKLSGSMGEKAPTTDSLFGSLGETFREKLDRIKKARNDKNVHALLLEEVLQARAEEVVVVDDEHAHVVSALAGNCLVCWRGRVHRPPLPWVTGGSVVRFRRAAT